MSEGEREKGGETDYGRKRAEIVRAALGVLREKGFEGTSLDSVAAELGRTKQAIYYYFKSKEQLVGSLILEMLREARARIGEICSADAEPRDRMRALILYYAEEHYARHGFFTLYHRFREHSADALPEAEQEETRRVSAEIPRIIIGLIEEGMAKGQFRGGDARALGGIVCAMLAGVLTHLPTPILAGADRKALAELTCEIVLKGMEP